MKHKNYQIEEPSTYTYVNNKLKLSDEEFYKSLSEKNIDCHSQVKNAKNFAFRLSLFISSFTKKNKINFLDCGCGFGFVAREFIKLRDDIIFYCDPSNSIKEIHKKIYPKENFFQSDIENLININKNFDIIYLREIYPFTRNNDFQYHKKLINILNSKLNTDGILIFEQIKNSNDLFDNLSKLKFRSTVIPLLPVRFAKIKFLNILNFKSIALQHFIKLMYKIFRKKINNFILVYKF